MRKKEDFNPNATIQLEGLDPDQLVLPDPASHPPPSRRTTPPPLPPSLPPSSIPFQATTLSVAPPPPRSVGRMVAFGAAFLVLLAVAIFAGARVGLRARGDVTPLASGVAPHTPAPSASSASPDPVMTIPTVEIR